MSIGGPYFDQEVIVGPLLKFGIVTRVVFVTGIFQQRVKIDDVVFVQYVRGQVDTPTIPPRSFSVRRSALEISRAGRWVRMPRTRNYQEETAGHL